MSVLHTNTRSILNQNSYKLGFILPYVNLRGYYTPDQKLVYFVLYLKIISTFLKMIYASYTKLSKELKNSIKIWVDQAVLELWSKQYFDCFDP